MTLTGEQMRDMLRFNVAFDLARANRDARSRPARTTKLVTRKLCEHHELETIGLVQNRLRIRCMVCGATAVFREKK